MLFVDFFDFNLKIFSISYSNIKFMKIIKLDYKKINIIISKYKNKMIVKILSNKLFCNI